MAPPRPVEEGCSGLRSGRALLAETGELVAPAAAARGGGRLVCSVCFSDAVVRSCVDRRDHFAHAARPASTVSAGESPLHRACKSQLCAALAIRHPAGGWAVERPIPARAEQGLREVIPDLSGRIGMHRVAVEVQASALGLASILERTQAYAARGIHVLWVIPVSAPPDPVLVRPKLHERYLHSLYFGRVYYWWPGLGASVVPVHFGPARREAAMSAPGEPRSSGAAYRTLRVPMAAPALDLSLDFEPLQRRAFTPRNERKAVPACSLWFDGRDAWW
jgi:competence protein CoiA